jgi:hypothetical protein
VRRAHSTSIALRPVLAHLHTRLTALSHSLDPMFCRTSCQHTLCGYYMYMYISSDGPSFLLSQKRSPISRTFDRLQV